MTVKNCLVEVYLRDSENNIVAVENGQGTTADDGVTCIINAGYCMGVATADPADIKVTVYQPAAEHQPAELLSRTEDTETLMSTLTFDLTP